MVELLQIDSENPDRSVMKRAREFIVEGKLVIFPTDTVYGLATDPFNEKAILQLLEAKKRTSEKGLPVLIANISMAEELVQFSNAARRLAVSFWPGSLTMVLPLKRSLSPLVTGNRKTLGIRIPNHPVARELAEIPIIGTSANVSGHASPNTALDALKQLGDSVDLVLDCGPTKDRIPSTVIDLSNSHFEVLREGVIKRSQLDLSLR
ncbi:MAG: threonylcarbamoyl-AMP synthase [Promethearchaeota archaeon]|nr:MAG: threonylcarbamoyl-AMP synthase [Candidatus Lokiarchaeota archaeon]